MKDHPATTYPPEEDQLSKASTQRRDSCTLTETPLAPGLSFTPFQQAIYSLLQSYRQHLTGSSSDAPIIATQSTASLYIVYILSQEMRNQTPGKTTYKDRDSVILSILTNIADPCFQVGKRLYRLLDQHFPELGLFSQDDLSKPSPYTINNSEEFTRTPAPLAQQSADKIISTYSRSLFKWRSKKSLAFIKKYEEKKTPQEKQELIRQTLQAPSAGKRLTAVIKTNLADIQAAYNQTYFHYYEPKESPPPSPLRTPPASIDEYNTGEKISL